MSKFLLVLFFLALMKPVFMDDSPDLEDSTQSNSESLGDDDTPLPEETTADAAPAEAAPAAPAATEDSDEDAGEDAGDETNILYHHIQGSCHLGEHLCVYDCCYYNWDGRNRCCHYKPWSPCCAAYGNYHSSVNQWYNWKHQVENHHHHPVVPYVPASHVHVHY